MSSESLGTRGAKLYLGVTPFGLPWKFHQKSESFNLQVQTIAFIQISSDFAMTNHINIYIKSRHGLQSRNKKWKCNYRVGEEYFFFKIQNSDKCISNWRLKVLTSPTKNMTKGKKKLHNHVIVKAKSTRYNYRQWSKNTSNMHCYKDFPPPKQSI